MNKLGTVCMVFFALGVTTKAVGASYISGPEGEFSTLYGRNLEYDPSRACIKPSKPYSNDQYSTDMYISSAKDYIECLKTAANRDVEYARKIVIAGYEEAAQEFVSEIRRGY